MNSKNKEALLFYYENFGKKAFQFCGNNKNAYAGTENDRCGGCGSTHVQLHLRSTHSFCDVCVSLAGGYIGLPVPQFMNDGWVAVVSENATTISNVKYASLFTGVPGITPVRITANSAIVQTIMFPPEPPFLVVEFKTANARACQTQSISYSKDLIYIGSDRYNAKIIRRFVKEIDRMGFDMNRINDVANAYSIITKKLRNGEGNEKQRQIIQKIEAKHPGITELVKAMPMSDTKDYSMLKRCVNAH
jgi:hypothetical protein